MTATSQTVELYDYEDEGQGFLRMRTEAWVRHRLISERVERIGENKVRLCNRPARVKASPGSSAERPWGVNTGRTPLWVPLQKEL